MPRYQFGELHSIRVAAPRDRTYQSIREVTADEILFFRTLTWIRRLGRRSPPGILNPPAGLPILEVATDTSFILLAAEPGREIVVGTVTIAPRGQRVKLTAKDFEALQAPGFALAAMNFRLEDARGGACIVTTETRIYATDSRAHRQFALYWCMIYPGSALIRRMWLRAIRRRAEKSAT